MKRRSFIKLLGFIPFVPKVVMPVPVYNPAMVRITVTGLAAGDFDWIMFFDEITGKLIKETSIPAKYLQPPMEEEIK